jgi:glutamate dehydrogenase (NADP+)
MLRNIQTLKYFDGARPWEVKCDIALPCATQNELNEDEAKALLLMVVFVLLKELTCLQHQKLFSIPNANYYSLQEKHLMLVECATSGLEMSQNSLRLSWSSEEVDEN